MKSQLLVVLLALCVGASAQYQKSWQSEEVGYPPSVYVVGIGNTDDDVAPELVYISNEPWDQNELYFWVLDLMTGEIDQVRDEFYCIATEPSKAPRLVDVDTDGRFEILFLASEDHPYEQCWFLYGYAPTGGVGGGYERVSGPRLGQNVPNPMRRKTRIDYDVPVSGEVKLRIYDASGRLVKDINAGKVEPGRHTATWHRDDSEGRPVPAGTYFYVLEADGKQLTRKALVSE